VTSMGELTVHYVDGDGREQDGRAERGQDGVFRWEVPEGTVAVTGLSYAGGGGMSAYAGPVQARPGVTYGGGAAGGWSPLPPACEVTGWPAVDTEGCERCPGCGRRHLRVTCWGGGG
jgi:hypothetical protein